jgi:hypothetical protein
VYSIPRKAVVFMLLFCLFDMLVNTMTSQVMESFITVVKSLLI